MDRQSSSSSHTSRTSRTVSREGPWTPRCLNGGTCVDGVGRYSCSCPRGFAGDYCEGDINECLTAACHNPGTRDCVQLINDYQCRCRLGTGGGEGAGGAQGGSSMEDLCHQKPCHHSGFCTMNMSSVHGYTCTCPPPWANCTASVPCWDLFRNDKCDKECDNSGCLFDSFECQEFPEC
ncbi:LOW QUALITY PROTEIN: hypothetical protein CRUP_006457, partial [Coryphaenoides rupestris]